MQSAQCAPCSALEASVQTVMSNALAIAVARQLIDYIRDLSRQLISANLIGKLEVFAPQLIFGKYGQGIARLGRSVVICGNMITLGEAHDCEENNKEKRRRFCHQPKNPCEALYRRKREAAHDV